MKSKIINVMAIVLNASHDIINDSFTPQTVERWDSLRHINLIVALEEEFNIEFDENDIPEMLSLSKIEAIVAAKLSGNG